MANNHFRKVEGLCSKDGWDCNVELDRYGHIYLNCPTTSKGPLQILELCRFTDLLHTVLSPHGHSDVPIPQRPAFTIGLFFRDMLTFCSRCQLEERKACVQGLSSGNHNVWDRMSA